MLIDIVLQSTIYSGNIGMIARVAKNFNIGRVRIVNPWCTIDRESLKFAAGSRDYLSEMELFFDLKQALKGYHLVIGTTARGGKNRNPDILTPEGAVSKASEIHGKTAILFGPEDRGLDNEAISLCNYLITIPCSDSHPSLNLSHSVSLIACEFFKTSTETPESPFSSNRRANFEETEGFYAHLENVLDRIGYFKTKNHRQIMLAFRRLGTKAALTIDDITILRGVFRQLSWYNETCEKVEGMKDTP